MHTHTRNLLVLIALTSILFLTRFQLHTTEAAILALSLEDLSRKAELIVKGEVFGKSRINYH